MAGAAIVGVLLLSVPFLISGGDGDDDRTTAKQGATPGTVLDGQGGTVHGVAGSQSPSPSRSTAPGKPVPKMTGTGPDGKTVTLTVAPPGSPAGGGKQPATKGGPTTDPKAPGTSSPGPKSGSGKASSGLGTSSSGSKSGSNTSSPASGTT
ncbi:MULTISPECIES: hypothetical protein [Streptomyces]|uniref:Uncharacterized protein n=1 Tax=Streptomyces nymphaeiformis TaxID=2663842 RepID=A0A7W7TX95_9ACTN|nr:hypothetical protein [Streptomyces nymphaeiformis]MBB4981069.1 hypothetical protein [Streptomyces nymphaeiformis]